MSRTERAVDLALLLLAPALAGGSLVWFFSGLGGVGLGLAPGSALAWDAALSLAFFLQHSLMVRGWAQVRLARWAGTHRVRALYALASGLALGAVALLWQPAGAPVYALTGAARLLVHALDLLALAGFAWGVVALGRFDAFGIHAIRDHHRGRAPPAGGLVIRGPYRWVRHPLYAATLCALWAAPAARPDRLLLNALWTIWMVAGTVLEERDLERELGEAYRAYQRRVPMLLPWRRPVSATPRPLTG